jgi:hypothetical protein
MRDEADEAGEAQPESSTLKHFQLLYCASSLIFHRRSANFELKYCARAGFSPRFVRFVRFVAENGLFELGLKKRFFNLAISIDSH